MPVKVNPTERDLVSIVARLKARLDVLERATSIVVPTPSKGLGAYYNVRDYGAVADGVTDDTPAINAATLACLVAGGGTVYMPGSNNDYLIGGDGVLLYNYVYLRGDGPGATRLRRKIGAGAERAVVQTYNLWLGFEAQQAWYWWSFGIADLAIDGNYGMFAPDYGATTFPTSPGGHGMVLNGGGYRIDNVDIYNTKYTGLLTLANNRPSWLGPQSQDNPNTGVDLETFPLCMVSHLRIGNSYASCGGSAYGGAELNWSGELDSYLHDIEIWSFCGSDPYFNYGAANPILGAALYVAPQRGGLKINNIHLFGSFGFLYGVLLDSTNMVITGGTLESTAPGGVLLKLRGGQNMYQGRLYDNTNEHTQKTGVAFGDALAPCGECVVDALITNCEQSGAHFANDIGGNILRGRISNYGLGTGLTGTISPISRVDVLVWDSAGEYRVNY